MSPSPMDWAPKAVPGTLPADAVFSDAPVVAYVSLNDAVFNFGHALFDFLFPVFNTLQLMDMYHPDFQLLLAEHQVSVYVASLLLRATWCMIIMYHCSYAVIILLSLWIIPIHVYHQCMLNEHSASSPLNQSHHYRLHFPISSFPCCVPAMHAAPAGGQPPPA